MTINIQGDIYDYKTQRWTKINTLTDKQLNKFRFITPDNVTYLINPKNVTQYKYTS